MQQNPQAIKNVSLLAHSGAGKTTLTEAALFGSGSITRLGNTSAGTTTSDYDPDEIKRKMSINLSIAPCEWKGVKVNLIDTPGYADFAGEVQAAIRVTEASIVVISATAGIEIGTELAIERSRASGLACLVFVNKMDRENADFNSVVEQTRARFGDHFLPIQLPIGSYTTFEGVVDLLSHKAFIGPDSHLSEVPPSLEGQVRDVREKLVEAIVELDDELLEDYLEGKDLTVSDLVGVLKKGVKSRQIVPILAGSALQGIGIPQLLDFMVAYLPSATEGEVSFISDGGEIKRSPVDPEGPLSALAFKTTADPYVGKLTYFRVYNGSFSSNSQVWNVNRGEIERVGQLFLVRGKTQEPVSLVNTGDIGGVAKLGVTVTGDTLAAKPDSPPLAPIDFPEPALSMAVYPKTKADLDKLGTALARIAEEDPTLRVHRDSDTSETILSGLGETQLEVVAEKMRRKFGVEVELRIPQVPYRETITTPAKAEYKHKKQTGGHGQYGHVLLDLEPLPRGSGIQFEDRVVGGAIPRNYIPAVEKGVYEAAREGVLAGYPVVDVKVAVYDGSYHPVDSSEICFKIAAAQAMKKGLMEGQPILMEPVMNLLVVVPEEFTGDIVADLNTKRARVQGMNPHDGYNEIQAQAPLAELVRYATDLRSITQGRSRFSLTFDHYEPVPPQIAQKIVTERQVERVEQS